MGADGASLQESGIISARSALIAMAYYFALSFRTDRYAKRATQADAGGGYSEWLAGEDLTRMIAQRLSILPEISVDPQVDVVAERWSWLVNLEARGIVLHLSVVEHPADEFDWQVSAFKKYDLWQRLFNATKLREAISVLRESLHQILETDEDITALTLEKS